MNLRIVTWTDEQIRTLREYGDTHPTEAMKILSGMSPPAGDIPGYVLNLKGGMRVVYSIEIDQPSGVCRHLSMSVDAAGQLPNPEAVLVLAGELGFRPDYNDGAVWVDEKTQSVNWVQQREI